MGEEKKYDLTYLRTISNNDDNFVKEMVTAFVTNTPEYFNDIKEFNEQGELDFLYKTVHKFIPTLAFVGATDKGSKFNKLESLAMAKKGGEELADLIKELEVYCEVVVEQLKADFEL